MLLKGGFKRIIINAVPGNHGRDSKYADKVTNWDFVLYNSLRIATRNYSEIEWNIACFLEDNEEMDNSLDNKYFVLLNPPFIFMHGNGIKMYNQVPWYGLTRRIFKWKSILPEIKVACLGHFHTSFRWRIAGVETIASASMVTDDDFALERLGEHSIAEQSIFGWNERNQKITWRFMIDVDERDENERKPLIYSKAKQFEQLK
mgnify:CR=1 FL=1